MMGRCLVFMVSLRDHLERTRIGVRSGGHCVLASGQELREQLVGDGRARQVRLRQINRIGSDRRWRWLVVVALELVEPELAPWCDVWR
jgi:hypothetical protein